MLLVFSSSIPVTAVPLLNFNSVKLHHKNTKMKKSFWCGRTATAPSNICFPQTLSYNCVKSSAQIKTYQKQGNTGIDLFYSCHIKTWWMQNKQYLTRADNSVTRVDNSNTQWLNKHCVDSATGSHITQIKTVFEMIKLRQMIHTDIHLHQLKHRPVKTNLAATIQQTLVYYWIIIYSKKHCEYPVIPYHHTTSTKTCPVTTQPQLKHAAHSHNLN